MHRSFLAIFASFALIIAAFGADTKAAERPPVMGRNAGVSAGHPLTAAAAFEIL
jgi:hypothetical protein